MGGWRCSAGYGPAGGRFRSSSGFPAPVVELVETPKLLDTGDEISPGLGRRLCREAGLVPAVLGGPSQVLDWGRQRRHHARFRRRT